MKIKTNDLIGAALDWAVAKCEGVVSDDIDDFCLSVKDEFAYSTSWALGGPLLDRKNISISPTYAGGVPVGWVAEHGYGITFIQCDGPTPLVAAMRCFVASHLGDEVDVPDELIT